MKVMINIINYNYKKLINRTLVRFKKNMISNLRIKEFYDNLQRNLQKNQEDYEFTRWFRDIYTFIHFKQTYTLLKNLLDNITFKNYVEVGPGSGIWTKLFIRYNNKAKFTLIDISKKMLDECKKKLSYYKNIKYINADFEKINKFKGYDMFFSARCLEYVQNKKKFLENSFKGMKNDGIGIIITKSPYIIKSSREYHLGQIDSQDLRELLYEVGYKEVSIYPVTLKIFIKNSIMLCISNFVWRRIFKKEINPRLLRLICESYLAIFKK